MSITVSPPNGDSDVISVMFDGEWSWDEFFAVLARVSDIALEHDRDMDVLIDFSRSAHFPSGFPSMARKMSGAQSSRTRRHVFVNMGGAPRMFLEMYKKIFPHQGSHYFTVNSMEDALALLAQPPAQ